MSGNQGDDETTAELLDELLSGILESCLPQPGKTPRYRHKSVSRLGFKDDDDQPATVSSPRVALPASARKLAQALTSAGLPCNEDEAEVGLIGETKKQLDFSADATKSPNSDQLHLQQELVPVKSPLLATYTTQIDDEAALDYFLRVTKGGRIN